MNLENNEIRDLTDGLIGPVEKEINAFNRKTAGAGLNYFKRVLGRTTEPFFKTNMGYRHVSGGEFVAGGLLWIGLGVASGMLFPDKASVLAALGHFHFLAPARFILWNKWIPILAGIIFGIKQILAGIDSGAKASKALEDGTPMHTRSRGIPRYPNETIALLKFLFWLMLLVWPVAVLFFIGYAWNKKLIREQDAAIRERYFDALDADLEKIYLKDAALGKCGTELSYLYHQISPSYKQEVREGMANALVSEPVSGLAQPPRKKGAAQPPQKPESPSEASAPVTGAAKSKPATEWEERERDIVAENPPEPVKAAGAQNDGGKIIPTPEMEAQFLRLWNLGRLIRKVVIVGLVILICAVVLLPIIYTIKHVSFGSHPSHTQGREDSPQTLSASVKPATSAPISTESKQLIDQANSALNAEIEVLLNFKTSCEATLNQDSTKAYGFGNQMQFAYLQAELKNQRACQCRCERCYSYHGLWNDRSHCKVSTHFGNESVW